MHFGTSSFLEIIYPTDIKLKAVYKFRFSFFKSVHCYTLYWNFLYFEVYEVSETVMTFSETQNGDLLGTALPAVVYKSMSTVSSSWSPEELRTFLTFHIGAWYYQTALQWQMGRCTGIYVTDCITARFIPYATTVIFSS